MYSRLRRRSYGAPLPRKRIVENFGSPMTTTHKGRDTATACYTLPIRVLYTIYYTERVPHKAAIDRLRGYESRLAYPFRLLGNRKLCCGNVSAYGHSDYQGNLRTLAVRGASRANAAASVFV